MIGRSLVRITMRDWLWFSIVLGILSCWYLDSDGDYPRTIFPAAWQRSQQYQPPDPSRVIAPTVRPGTGTPAPSP